MDHIQSSALLDYLTRHRLISTHQFGFLPKLSTTKQLVYITELWHRALAQGNSTVAVFMDFQKAFDKVWHSGLLYKLGQCGIDLRARLSRGSLTTYLIVH